MSGSARLVSKERAISLLKFDAPILEVVPLHSMMADGLNDGGRGFNIAVFSPKSMTVVRVGHFDTYAQG